MKRFYVLDALRFLLALCVAIGHAGLIPIFGPVGQEDQFLDLAARAWRTVAYGPAAVIAFFVISGFCIHYPFAIREASCPLGRFYARRYLRILVPVMMTVLLFRFFIPGTQILGPGSILWRSTLWSIVCEEAYYAAYPGLNRLNRLFGWGRILALAILVSAALSCWYLSAVEWQDMGIVATTLILFPVWLLGCHLAEHAASFTVPLSVRDIWLHRFGAWFVMWIALVLHSHTALHQTVTGLWVGIAFYFWIRAELRYYRDRQPWRSLVLAGRWSYSLYLIHPLIIALTWRYGLQVQAGVVSWLAVMAMVLGCSYIFYLLVERPSHRLARRIALFTDNPAPLIVPAASTIQTERSAT